MNLSTLPSHFAATASAGPEPASDAATPDDDGCGCGWFDSSRDLAQGIQVRELSASDESLPLAWWLQWQSGPQQPVRFA